MKQNVGESPSSVMDKGQHWLKDLDLMCSVKKMYYINGNITVKKAYQSLPLVLY
jgi:hypothetical protein